MSTIVTSKGQVTIPKRVRDYLGIKPGSAVEFDVRQNGEVVVQKAGKKPKRKHSRIEALRGIATVGMTTDEIMALTRGDE